MPHGINIAEAGADIAKNWHLYTTKLQPHSKSRDPKVKIAVNKVRLAKIDCDTHSKAKGTFQVSGFPTIIYF